MSSSMKLAASTSDMMLNVYGPKKADIIADLQKRWHCDYHSKTFGKDVECYTDPSSSYYYPLAACNLGYWAAEIVHIYPILY